MTITQFDHGYWYAAELKHFATKLVRIFCGSSQFGPSRACVHDCSWYERWRAHQSVQAGFVDTIR